MLKFVTLRPLFAFFAHRGRVAPDVATDELTFEEWWRDFHTHGMRGLIPNEAEAKLARYIEDLSDAKREAFLDELTDLICRRGEDWSTAADVVEAYASRAQRARVLAVVEGLPEARPPAPLGDYRGALLRVLARDPSGEFLGPVRAYGEQPIGHAYTDVITSLWPHQARLFATFHARYLAEQPRKWWAETGVMGWLVSEPEALAAVRDVLLERYPAVWPDVREAALKYSAREWHSADARAKVRSVCAGHVP